MLVANLAAMQALLGDAVSQRSVRSAIHHLVSLRRYEQMSVHQTLQGIKLTTVTAISPQPHHGQLALPVTGCYLLLLAVTCTHCNQPTAPSWSACPTCYWLSPTVTGCYPVLPAVTDCHWLLPALVTCSYHSLKHTLAT